MKKLTTALILAILSTLTGCGSTESTSCDDVCDSYGTCAGFTEEITTADIEEAKTSCKQECAKWSDETKKCITKQPIKAPMDCSNLSMCALKEYQDLIPKDLLN